MIRKNEWEIFFDAHAPVYMENSFTKNTKKEVDFILQELKLPPGSNILDIGCGTGRHALELARRGYLVTGVDISSGMLAQAEKEAKKSDVKLELIHADATRFKSNKLFDTAICLCEGAFGLLGSGDDPKEHDLMILRNIQKALKPDRKLISTMLNGLSMIRRFTQKDVGKGRFDPINMVETYDQEYDTPEGKKSVQLRERGYLPAELFNLFSKAGFMVEHIGGGTAGKWGRRQIDLDEIEIMVIAKKSVKGD